MVPGSAGYYLRGVQLTSNSLTCCHDSRMPASLQLKGEIVDSGTQVQGIHACAATTPYATGVNIDQNLLLCSGT